MQISLMRNSSFRYTSIVIQDFLLGFLLFLLTEFLIFVALFAVWLYCAINPSIWVGGVWPPQAVYSPQPLYLPLYSTFILFTSSCSLIWFELSLQLRLPGTETLLALGLTIFAGFHFLLIQIIEFSRLPFNFSDSIYASTFYAITGLHFLHIIVGLGLLTGVLVRLFNQASIL